jgi:RNA-directed DNA polymerase
MRVPRAEGLATHSGPESCVVVRKGGGEALTGERAGRVWSRESFSPSRERRVLRGGDAVEEGGRPHRGRRDRETPRDPRAVGDPAHVRKRLAREPGDPASVCGGGSCRPHREVERRTPMMDGRGKSDRPIVPQKPPNKAEAPAAEVVEGRGRAKGNLHEQNAPRTQGRIGVSSALERVRQAAIRDRKQRFTALLHHVYDIERLRAAYLALKREAAPGIDGETWQSYGADLEGNIRDLAARLQRGAYRASPVRRAWIPKAGGRLRPLGVPTLEDKIVQRAVVEVLNAIYEADFLGFSYGFRPGRSPHHALDALTVGITRKKVSWVLDADLRDFFDTLDHGWLVKFIEHRVADRRVVRLIQKWLRAGVLEEGQRTRSEAGTVQGGSISPLLANVYLHFVFDLWTHHWRRKRARGDVVVVRFADDFVVGFEHRHEAERFLIELGERFARFGLELAPEKTRLIEFGRFAAERRWRRGQGKPETFNFLGFTHICGKTRKGKFMVLRRTMRQRMQAKLKAVKAELRQRMHAPLDEQGAYVRAVVAGHVRYYGVPMNSRAIGAFRVAVGKLWWRSLRRRSQRHHLPWRRMEGLIDRWLPPARICHPYPWARQGVSARPQATRGGSRMR